MKICTCSLLGTVPALALATTLAAQNALNNGTSGKADGTTLQLAAPAVKSGKVTRWNGSGFLAGGNVCAIDNGVPGGCLGSPAAQEDPPDESGFNSFFAEAADDFEFVDVGQNNPCLITDVTFWIAFFGGDAVDHPDDITGVHVTVYGTTNVDGVEVPDGAPVEDGSGGHTGAIAAEFKLSGPDITIGEGVEGVYQVDVTNLSLLVPKNTKLWLAPAVQLDVDVFSQVANQVSDVNNGEPAVQIFPAAGLPDWALIGGCEGQTDLAFVINGVKDDGQFPDAPCPYDCGPPADGRVAIVDLLALLGGWGVAGPCDVDGNNGGDVVDLLGMLAAWGGCPFAAPSNDECEDKIQVDTAPSVSLIDLKGATPSDPPPVNTTPGGDVWYCTTAPEAGTITITTTADVYAEVYEGCTCPPGTVVGSGRTMSLTGLGGVKFVATGANDYCIRLINDLGIDDEGTDNALKGAMALGFQPALENCDDALEIALDTPISGDTTDNGGQTTNVAGICEAFAQGVAGDWYKVTGPVGGAQLSANLSIDITVVLWGGAVSVYCGQCGVSLECVGSCLTGVLPCGDLVFPDITATVGWCAEEDETYYVLVHGVQGPFVGPYTLEITNDGGCIEDPPFCGPENDACADMLVTTDTSQAQNLDTQPNAAGVTLFDTDLATTDGIDTDDTAACNDFGETQTWKDLWWSYTATCTGVLTFTTCPELIEAATGYLPPDPYDTDIVIYGPYADMAAAIADCPPPVDMVAACNDDDPVNACGTAAPFASTLDIIVAVGDTYICRVGGWGPGNFGEGEFMLDCVEGVPEGACFDNGGTNCLDFVSILDCNNCGYQQFFQDQLCADVESVQCEYFQRGFTPEEAWTFGFADQERDLERAEDVDWIGGPITSLTWIGDDADINAAGQCDQPDMAFDITIYGEDFLNPGFPNNGNILCAFDDIVATQVVTGDNYASGIGPLLSKIYSVTGLAGCNVAAQTIFVGITGVAPPDDSCEFIWLSSPDCNNSSVIRSPVADPDGWAVSGFSLTLCINGSLELAIGACCVDQVCTDDLTQGECQSMFGEFILDTCANIGACPAAKCQNAIYEQRPTLAAEGGFTALTSDSEPLIRRYDDYVSDGTAVTSISFWAITLSFDPDLGFTGDCTDNGLTFQVGLYPVDQAGNPNRLAAHCLIDGITASSVSNEDLYDFGAFTAQSRKYTLDLVGCDPNAATTWVSIMADATNGDACYVLIMDSPAGNGSSVFDDPVAEGDFTGSGDDLNFCINP